MEEGNQRKVLAIPSWIIFLALCSGAGYMVVHVFQQFFSESSSIKQFEEPITEFPTIMVCTPKHGIPYPDYDIDFEIGTYGFFLFQDCKTILLKKNIVLF